MLSKARSVKNAFYSSSSPGEACFVLCHSCTMRRSQQVARNYDRAGAFCCVHCGCDSAALARGACKRARARLELCSKCWLGQQVHERGRSHPSLSVAPYAKAVPMGKRNDAVRVSASTQRRIISNTGHPPVERHSRHNRDDHQGNRYAESRPASEIPLAVELAAFACKLGKVRSNQGARSSWRMDDDASTRIRRYGTQPYLFLANVAQQRSGCSAKRRTPSKP